MIEKKTWLKKLLVLVLVAGGLAGGYQYFYGPGIYSYKPGTDRAFIVDFFERNRYWLVKDETKDFSIERVVDHLSPSNDPQDYGKLTLKMYRISGKPVGFAAYYMLDFQVGWLLFLAVDETHRSKGYAQKLLNAAIQDLKKRGAQVVRLVTRTDNKRARNLYENRFGFRQIWTDGAYIIYEKKPI